MRESDQNMLADRYLDLYQMAFAILHSQCDAEDAVQEALVRTLTRPIAVRDPLHYCVRVLRNYCMDKLNEKLVVTDRIEALGDADDTPIQRLLHVRLEGMEEARRCLPERTNQLLDMHYAEGLTLQEIADRTGVSAPMVRKLFKRAYRQIRKKIVLAEINE